MPSFRYGGKRRRKLTLSVSPDYLVVRTKSREALDHNLLRLGTSRALDRLRRQFALPAHGIEVHHVLARRSRSRIRDGARMLLKDEPEVEFAGRVLCDPRSKEPVLYTENLFVKFASQRGSRQCRKVLREHGLEIKREVPYVRNGFFVGAPCDCGLEVFDVAEKLLQDETVELCHPELVRQASRRTAFPEQWHLRATTVDGAPIDAHAHVEDAWALSEGAGVVIAVIDDGFDLAHEELASPDKVVAPRDATHDGEDPRPGPDDDHGTACAGVACADGLHGAAGVAPRAKLMPIRLVSGIGSQDEADALAWAAEHGADVISCSWGPVDGDYKDPDDPLHTTPHLLPDATRLALEFATEQGRGGKGCVITWAAGNGGVKESVDLDDYASSERVIAVAATNENGVRSVYSEVGEALWCAFPSGDFRMPRLTRGIWTTDRTGRPGYNKGRTKEGDRAGNYTNSFTGTSSACPGVAGVAALVLAVAPELTWRQVKDLLRDACDPVDPEHGEYDAETGHSLLYGFGRVNAARAVALAAEKAAAGTPLVAVAAPASAELSVRLTTGATSQAVWIDDCRLTFAEGLSRVPLEPGRPYILSWWLAGEPATDFRIELDAGDLAIEGDFPIAGTIGQDTKTAGSRRLVLSSPTGGPP